MAEMIMALAFSFCGKTRFLCLEIGAVLSLLEV
jgi:hypothetical protein